VQVPDLPTDSEADDDDSGSSDDSPPDPTPAADCASGMVLVDDGTLRFCVDAFEGALEERQGDGTWSPAEPWYTVGAREVRAVPAAGIPPQGYISGIEAAAACEASGKRLCSEAEWLLACRGEEGWTWPYGPSHVPGACNDDYGGSHPVVDFFGTSDGVWDSEHMNDPGINQQAGTLEPGGSREACVSAWGAFDMHGNLHEWTAEAGGSFRGGFYADAELNGPGCTYVTTAHDGSWHDYSTGFRCCAEAKAAR
jgi:hypothetical protein